MKRFGLIFVVLGTIVLLMTTSCAALLFAPVPDNRVHTRLMHPVFEGNWRFREMHINYHHFGHSIVRFELDRDLFYGGPTDENNWLATVRRENLSFLNDPLGNALYNPWYYTTPHFPSFREVWYASRSRGGDLSLGDLRVETIWYDDMGTRRIGMYLVRLKWNNERRFLSGTRNDLYFRFSISDFDMVSFAFRKGEGDFIEVR